MNYKKKQVNEIMMMMMTTNRQNRPFWCVLVASLVVGAVLLFSLISIAERPVVPINDPFDCRKSVV